MHPELLSLSLFFFVTSCSPGPNNIVASHSGFNHGVKKTIPLMLGVIFGFTSMLSLVNFGLINIFKLYPIIQKILVFTGSAFLVYLAYRISFSKSSNQKFAIFSILFWTLIGKFMRKFATNEKFIKWFNYVMSALLLGCIATFYY